MEINNVILAIEDRLSDAVATKILNHFGIEIVQKTGYRVILTFNRKRKVSIKELAKNVVYFC